MTLALEPTFAAAAPERRRISLLGLQMDAITERGAVEHIIDAARHGRGGWVITPNVDHLQRTARDADFASCFTEADLIICDGMPLVWASRIQGTPLPERVTGSDLIWSLSVAASKVGIPIYLLGGKPGTAEKAGRVLRMHFPGLNVAGVECPPLGFEKDEAYLDAIVSRLRASQPGIVFVALGSPKQEFLIRKIRHCLPNAWWIGVGISFSFITGDVKRAPDWMRKHGLEWAHRMVQEPKRLAKRYLVDDLPFLLLLLWRAVCRGITGRTLHRPRAAATAQERASRSWMATLALVIAAHLPLLAYAGTRLWAREAYQFFPMTWTVAAVLAVTRLRHAPTGPPRAVAGGWLLALGTLVLSYATISWTWSLALFALPMSVAGLLLLLGGVPFLRAFAAPALLFLTTLPPPFGTDTMLLTLLRQQAVHWSGKILDTLGVLHVISGNLIDIPGHRLFVAEACSGINSTISSVAFAVGCAAVLRRGGIHLFLLAFFGLFFAIVCNILRITAGAAFLQWWEIDLINGWKHETVGLIIFAACVGLILSFDQILHFVLKPVHERATKVRDGAIAWPRVAWPTVGLAAAACAISLAGLVFVAPQVTWSAPMWAQGNLPESAKFTLPDQVGRWERYKSATELRAETEGVKSEFWTYSLGDTRVIIALDFPFPGYHDLAFCYHVQGWTTDYRGTANDGGGAVEQIELSRAAGKATLYFVLYDESGRWLVNSMDQSFRDNFWRRVTTLRRHEVDARPAYQMQALVCPPPG